MKFDFEGNSLTASFSSLSVAFVNSMLEKGISEFFTDGIIHCWNNAITMLTPTTTSRILLIKNLLRILVVRGKFNS